MIKFQSACVQIFGSDTVQVAVASSNDLKIQLRYEITLKSFEFKNRSPLEYKNA